VNLFLVHHGEAVLPDVDARRPLSPQGHLAVAHAAAEAAARGARPDVVWHSGKLRARQTAEVFWRTCNALAEFAATRDLQPEDPPGRFRDRLRGEARDVLIAGHFPHLPKLLALLIGPSGSSGHSPSTESFPPHGVVALTSDDGRTWREVWRIEAGKG
jgi:phosphohistidine phosphatase